MLGEKYSQKTFSVGRRVFTCSNKSEVSVLDSSYFKAMHVTCHELFCVFVRKSQVETDVVLLIIN